MNKTRILAFAALVAAATALASGCTGEGGNDAQDAAAGSAASRSQSGDDLSGQAPMGGDEQPKELSAAHILIMHKDSQRAPAEITRSRQEALALAQQVAKEAKTKDADFAALAKKYSDGPSGPRGGSLGNFEPDRMVKPFSDATMKLAIGEVSDPVETAFGYHVIRRQKVKVIPKAGAKHILVQYRGSMRAPASITRTKKEAHARIQECLKRSEAGEAFEDLAREYSDGPSGPSGGDLGEFPEGVMAPAFDTAVFSCEVGKVTGIVETPFGSHIIYRYK